MTGQVLISSTQEYAALVPILQGLKVPHDAVLVVHSAIAPLSRRGFRAEAMVEALMGYLHDGTIVMPTMTWRTVTPQNPVWDEATTPSHTGVLTEVFRTRYSNFRSIHPTHSVAGCGPHARALLARVIISATHRCRITVPTGLCAICRHTCCSWASGLKHAPPYICPKKRLPPISICNRLIRRNCTNAAIVVARFIKFVPAGIGAWTGTSRNSEFHCSGKASCSAASSRVVLTPSSCSGLC